MQDKVMKNKRGFTIIELSLSIVFISTLSILVVVMIANAVSSYHRGVTLNQINTVGMDIVDDIRAAIQGSSARSVMGMCEAVYEGEGVDGSAKKNCEDDLGMTLVMAQRTGGVEIGNVTNTGVPLYGAFCTGGYSYVWNSGYFFSDDYKVEDGLSRATLKYKLVNDDTIHEKADFRLLKVKDGNRLVCRAAKKERNASLSREYLSSAEAGSNLSAVFDISANGIEEEPTDVLEGSGSLAIYDLTSALPAESGNSNNLFYSVSFILGTVQGGINVMSSGNYCATPGGQNPSVENFDYCAINKFNFAAQATGG